MVGQRSGEELSDQFQPPKPDKMTTIAARLTLKFSTSILRSICRVRLWSLLVREVTIEIELAFEL